MKKLKWNRLCTILVLLMFITVTYASFNTNLFINGNAYLRVDKDIRITNIHLLETEYNGYENTNSEYTVNSVSMDVSLPRQASSLTYEVTISNVSDKRYKITDILESSYNNKNVKYELVDASIGNIVEPHTEKTVTIKFTNNVTVVEEDDVYETKEYTFDYTGDVQEFLVPYDGTYKIELWGAQGGEGRKHWNTLRSGGLGAYTTGEINLKKNQLLYVYVGQKGIVGGTASKFTGGAGGYNGGGKGGNDGNKDDAPEPAGGGGGATDIRLKKDEWSEFASLQSRIMVAGGGGGGCFGNLGAAGGIQTAATNTFGIGGNGYAYTAGSGGGGGGYLGGKSVNQDSGLGNGGTSYISGHDGSKAIKINAKKSSLSYETTSNHYSGLVFNNTKMVDGEGYEWTTTKAESSTGMPTHDGTSTMTGNSGNGYAKITVTRKIENGSSYAYEYKGQEELFTAPYTGIYKLEVWGAQGGSYNETYHGGYGGYSTGEISFNKGEQLYINVGGSGINYGDKTIVHEGGYNGGGSAESSQTGVVAVGTGGGATHIAKITGLLSSLNEVTDQILIVAGGGGGSVHYYASNTNLYYGVGGSAGGYIGNTGISSNIKGNYKFVGLPTGGTQENGGQAMDSSNDNGENYDTSEDGSFGQGGGAKLIRTSGGGGEYYGGASGIRAGGGGGSGYINYPLLKNKVMYCYNCEESRDSNTKTVTTQAHSKIPKQNQAKEGNGFSRITLLKRTINQTALTLDFAFEEY
ncbi:MAG: hypothetical protein IJ193_01920, partial [Bacilli bacterium]|nr:hypothetical protein [Bacilli bacterium]